MGMKVVLDSRFALFNFRVSNDTVHKLVTQFAARQITCYHEKIGSRRSALSSLFPNSLNCRVLVTFARVWQLFFATFGLGITLCFVSFCPHTTSL